MDKPTAVDYNTPEVKKLLTEKCEACGDCFTTVRGLNVHQRQHYDLPLRMDNSEYEVEKVLAARGPAGHRFYLLNYEGLVYRIHPLGRLFRRASKQRRVVRVEEFIDEQAQYDG